MAKPVTPRFTVRTETPSDARGVSRRQLLRGTAALALTTAAGGILAACGESSVVSTAPMTTTTGALTVAPIMNRSGTPAAPLAATSGVMPTSMGAPKKGGRSRRRLTPMSPTNRHHERNCISKRRN